MRSLLLTAVLVLAAAAPARAAADPIDHTRPAAPDGTPMCADWVHDRYAVGRGGRVWATWHPPRDPRYRCAFGHEHGSNPRAFRHFGRTGMPVRVKYLKARGFEPCSWPNAQW